MHPRLSQILWIGLTSLSAFLFVAFLDFDRDGLDDAWETQYGFSTNAFSSTDLTGWWQLDDGTGKFAADRSTNNLPLALKGNPIWTNGLFFGGVSLDGKKDYLEATPAAAFNPSNFTFSAWVKLLPPAKKAQEQTVVYSRDTKKYGWQIFVGADGRIRAQFDTLRA